MFKPYPEDTVRKLLVSTISIARYCHAVQYRYRYSGQIELQNISPSVESDASRALPGINELICVHKCSHDRLSAQQNAHNWWARKLPRWPRLGLPNMSRTGFSFVIANAMPLMLLLLFVCACVSSARAHVSRISRDLCKPECWNGQICRSAAVPVIKLWTTEFRIRNTRWFMWGVGACKYITRAIRGKPRQRWNRDAKVHSRQSEPSEPLALFGGADLIAGAQVAAWCVCSGRPASAFPYTTNNRPKPSCARHESDVVYHLVYALCLPHQCSHRRHTQMGTVVYLASLVAGVCRPARRALIQIIQCLCWSVDSHVHWYYGKHRHVIILR